MSKEQKTASIVEKILIKPLMDIIGIIGQSIKHVLRLQPSKS